MNSTPPIEDFIQWSNEFELRAQLTSKIILKGKYLPKYQKNNILQLIKSDIYEDLILAQEIMKQLAI